MAVDFRLAQHSLLGTKIVEVLMDGIVVGAIYPSSRGIKIVSAHFFEKEVPKDFDGQIIEDDGSQSFPPIPSFEISFNPRHYVILGNKIQYLE